MRSFSLKSIARGIIGFLLFISAFVCQAQFSLDPNCTGCTISISSNAQNYTLTAGQTACIVPGFEYTGNIKLDGGILCNDGTVHNIEFLSGTFNNYGKYVKTSGTLMIRNTGQVVINNYAISPFMIGDATLTMSLNNVVIQSVSASNEVRIVNNPGSMITIKGDLMCYNGSVRIDNNLFIEQANTLQQSDFNSRVITPVTAFSNKPAIVNVGRGLTVTNSATFILNNNQAAIFNVANSMSLDGKGNKTVNNYGAINITNNLSVGGSGRTNTLVSINNSGSGPVGTSPSNLYGNFSIRKAFSVSPNNTQVQISNSGLITLVESYTQGSPGVSFTNQGRITAVRDINVAKGSFTNTGNISARDFKINATLTNNMPGQLLAERNFTVSGTGSTLNNSGAISVNGLFTNSGTVTMLPTGAGGYFQDFPMLIRAVDLNNTSSGTINGPTQADPTEFNPYPIPLILVERISTNAGYLNNYLAFWDYTPPASGTILIDDHSNDSRISPNVIYYPPCPFVKISIASNPSPPLCYGATAQLTASSAWVLNFPPFITINLPITPTGGNSGYTWNPGNFHGNPFTTPGLTSSSTFNVSALYFGNACTSAKSITLSVSSQLLVNGGLDRCLQPGNSTTLGGQVLFGGTSPTASGGSPPYSYSWNVDNSNTLVNSTTANPTLNNPNLPTNVSLVVTDAQGCTASDLVLITLCPPTYAILSRIPDGGYYQLYLGKLYFKIEGEYNNTNLVYNVYDKANAVVASNTSNNIANSTAVIPGDNRFHLDVGNSSLIQGNYILEVINEKNEKTYLRFKK